MRKQRKKLWVACIVLVLTLLMSGCRESPVLQQIIYTQDASKVDTQEEQLDPSESGEETQDFRNEIEEDADTQRDTDQEGVAQEDAAEDVAEANQSDYDPNGESDLDANVKGKDNHKAEGSGGTAGDKGESSQSADTDQDGKNPGDDNTGEDTPSESDTGEIPSEDTGETETPPEGEEQTPSVPEEDPSGDDANKETVTDGDGDLVEIPTDAVSVAAVGAAAEMVEMVAGSGHLVASSESFVTNTISQSIFSDVSTGSVQSLWSGTGKTQIADINSLLAIEGLNLCFYFSGQSFSADQIAALEGAGISCVALPALDNAQNLKDAVQIVATAFKETTDGASMDVSDGYSAWVDTAISEVGNPNYLAYSFYVSEWRSDITYTFSAGAYYILPNADAGGVGSGVAIGYSAEKKELISTFMAAAGVENETTLQSGGGREGMYITPMFHQLSPIFSSDEYCYLENVLGIGQGHDWFVSKYISDQTYLKLGASPAFPAIIVKSQEIKDAMQSSYYWNYKGVVSNGVINFTDGVIDPVTGEALYGGLGGTYDIYINPSGVGDWAEGSLESPLEAYWVAYKFGNGTTSQDVLNSKVLEFYNTFYHADARSLLTTILKE